MPRSPLKPCSVPGCPQLVPGGKCAAHRHEYDRARGNAAQRGYDAHWRQTRKRVLMAHGWCQHPGCDRLATDVDHIIPRRDGGPDTESNLQALCGLHHRQKTRAGE